MPCPECCVISVLGARAFNFSCVLINKKLKFGVFWEVGQCSLIGVSDVSELRTASIIMAMMEAVCTSETSVHSNETIRRHIPKESQLHTRHRENVESQNKKMFDDRVT
jgi:hypothetical protein